MVTLYGYNNGILEYTETVSEDIAAEVYTEMLIFCEEVRYE